MRTGIAPATERHMPGELGGRRIVVPESRELDLFVSILERAGATAIRCPLVSILDLDDPTPVRAWIGRLVEGGLDDVVLYTGEGLRRMASVAADAGATNAFVAALARVRTIVRGPKPARVLRTLGLGPDLAAGEPTTDGLIATLSTLDLASRRVGVQLYPEYPPAFLAFLEGRGATVDPVLPYRYASDEEDGRVVEVLHDMAAGEVDAIALTSTPQVRRLVEVARKRDLGPVLAEACRRTLVTAVGPVTADAARAAGWRVAVVPDASFHLKPFVAALSAHFAADRAQAAIA